MTLNCGVQKLGSWDTQLYADCVEFCPYDPFLSIAVCGNYQLCESESARIGRLNVHSVNLERLDLTPIQQIDTPGILDIKWCRQPINNQLLLAAANALGEFVLYKVNNDSTLSQLHSTKIQDDNRLALFCDWWQGEKVSVSDSKGYVHCLSVNAQGSVVESSWKGHEYEAWVASFDRHDGNLVYSGGDDCCFRMWDLRDTSSALITNKKAHQMGVTSIETSPFNPNLLATGSYDERLLLWDKRQMKIWLNDTNLGGGVWKIRWEPEKGRYMLVAAMHNGFHIVDSHSPLADQDSSASDSREPEIVTSYKEHSSLAYGCDWSRQTSCSSGRKTIATCSFYDHSLQLWTWGIDS